MTNIFNRERYSLCLVHVEEHRNAEPYYKFFRVADFNPEESSDELVPAIVEDDVTTFEERRANPDHLYNPSAREHYESRKSDFCLLKWWPDPNDSGKQITRSFYDLPILRAYKEPREVIFLDGCRSEADLRRILSEGIPFKGKTTSVFYMVYERQGDALLAIQCRRADFSFSDEKIKLPVRMTNTRATVLSAPRVVLNNYDIIESPHHATDYRKVYAKLGELEPDGSVLLRPLSYYASDYVKWFIREESNPVTKSDKRKLSQIIETALNRPDAFEAYLGAEVPEEEVSSFKKTIRRLASEEDDSSKELFRKALLEDESFHQECVEQVMKESEGLLAERRAELNVARNQLNELQASIKKAQSELCSMEDENTAKEEEIHLISSEIARLKEERAALMTEFQENIALKLGLRTVASFVGDSSSTSSISVVEGAPVECRGSNDEFGKVLARNMKRLGLASVDGKSEDERLATALSVEGCLAVTRTLAIPQPIANAVADALSVAIDGKFATKIRVPADCRDVSKLLNLIDGSGVVLVEGIIDSVNEGLLAALLYENHKSIVILSFMSHGSARLVAPEAWERMFMPYVETLVFCPLLAKNSGFERTAYEFEPRSVSADDALEGAASVKEELPGLRVSDGAALIAGAVLQAMMNLVEDGPIEFSVSQYIAISSIHDKDQADELVAWWSENDTGLARLVEKLGIDEG